MTNERLTDRKRAAIVQAAVAEFRARGFEATSMDQVAATAEVSKRTLYNHFASKEALFAQILRQLWDRSAARMDLAYRPDLPLAPQLSALLLQKVALVSGADFIDLARVALTATLHSPQRAQDMLQRLAQKENALLTWVCAAQQDGRLKPADPLQVVQQMESLVKGSAFWPQVTLGQPRLGPRMQKQLAADTAELVLSRYAA
ncbi:TetR/AcrR family transcriptional regulator [Comamonas antarctica]|uniref:TetR/AcrR family transcriptional regulator n=1 Tax=Comamonas antarctica TaxID=2743470 RepID=A0A6N1XBQ2_9BURK|nr:TetR/AcrR family transcriptional regulator [Comamonas antarctica]QKV55502.1 TetR/AcrR family transcriptional regulator [Comamonas antarctica]